MGKSGKNVSTAKNNKHLGRQVKSLKPIPNETPVPNRAERRAAKKSK